MSSWNKISEECGRNDRSITLKTGRYYDVVSKAIAEQKEENENTKDLVKTIQRKIEEEIGLNPEGYDIVFGLNSPLTSQRFYVCKPKSKYDYDFAENCKEPSGFDAGGFENIDHAVTCFLSIYGKE
ncbi:MAG: hypothetical protein AAF316_00340 [Cyanobacteria bacterium P01_A01_bin.80]